MKTSEVLYEAANLIEFRGWARGNGWTDQSDGAPLCLEGAIAAAMQVRGGPGFRCPAYDAVASYVGKSPWMWNDYVIFQLGDDGFPNWKGWLGGGTKAEAIELGRQQVIATLRAAAVIEAAKEQAAVDTPAVSVAPVRSGL